MGRLRVAGEGIRPGADGQELAVGREGDRVDRPPLLRIDLRHGLASRNPTTTAYPPRVATATVCRPGGPARRERRLQEAWPPVTPTKMSGQDVLRGEVDEREMAGPVGDHAVVMIQGGRCRAIRRIRCEIMDASRLHGLPAPDATPPYETLRRVEWIEPPQPRGPLRSYFTMMPIL